MVLHDDSVRKIDLNPKARPVPLDRQHAGRAFSAPERQTLRAKIDAEQRRRLGIGPGCSQEDDRARVLAFLGAGPCTFHAVKTATGISEARLRGALRALTVRGQVERVRSGRGPKGGHMSAWQRREST